ncbi:uncharacterized protein LOC133830564 [Humulus lupulus]|uniref:uncharacterized protein LOC133830564 n=1 Tax=Humulus lupulus TaxID=3486 RepID=UPI002B408CB6|nr:uncharacterized protein LOC133830564 [Humulus lupulus]
MAARTLVSLLVILLGFSHLTCSNAIPLTRNERLMQGIQVHLPPGTNNLARAESIWEAQTIPERVDVELHDYPGSGANNRHTPKPQGKCAEC